MGKSGKVWAGYVNRKEAPWRQGVEVKDIVTDKKTAQISARSENITKPGRQSTKGAGQTGNWIKAHTDNG